MTEYKTSGEWEQNLKDNYWDLAQHFTEVGSYADYEGFTPPDRILELVDHPDIQGLIVGEAHADLYRDMLIHYVHECMEQAEPPTIEVLGEVAVAFMILFSCRYWMKSTATDKKGRT